MIDWKIAILVPILPTLGFFIMLLFGGRMPRKGEAVEWEITRSKRR